jgi:VRR-NUC domain
MVSLHQVKGRTVQVLKPLESEIERRCKTIAEKHQCILLKVEKRKGWPDRILLAPTGRLSWVEFKRPGERLMPMQEIVHQQLRAMRFRVETVDNYLTFLTLLQDLCNQFGPPLPIKSAAPTG